MRRFPIGTVVGGLDARFEITEHLYGEVAYGVYRARSLSTSPYRDVEGKTMLVTTTIGLTEPASELLRYVPMCGLRFEGIFDITSVDGNATVLVEEEPTGCPSTTVTPMSPTEAYALTIEVIDQLQAYNNELAILTRNPNAQCQGLHPALVYVGPGHRLSGVALRSQSFFLVAKKPCHGAIMPFYDFMSPEAALGKKAAPTSDSALVAQCLAYWLTGESLYDFNSLMELVMAISTGQRRSFALPKTVETLIRIGTSPDPKARPPLSIMRDWLCDSLAKELGHWSKILGPGGIARGEFRDLVFYAVDGDDDEPGPQTPSLVLSDFSDGTGSDVPLTPDFAPRITLLDRDDAQQTIARAIKRHEGRDGTAQAIEALHQALRWIVSRPESWIVYQLEPKSLSGKGIARATLLADRSAV